MLKLLLILVIIIFFVIIYLRTFDPAALGVFTVKGRNKADRENKLWDMIQTISNEPLKYLTYETV